MVVGHASLCSLALLVSTAAGIAGVHHGDKADVFEIGVDGDPEVEGGVTRP